MWTIDSIKKFYKDFGFKPSSTKSEIKELSKLLHADEQLHGLLEGFLKNIHGRSINGLGLVIATNKRVIFFRKSIIGTVTKEEIPLNKVTSASYRKGLMFSSISITSASNDSIVEQCDKKISKKFIDNLLGLINNQPNISNNQDNNFQNDPLLKLEKLYELKQKGILTEDEYNQQKSKILNS